MPPDQDRLPLLPPPLTDDPPPFSSHPEYHTSPPPSTDTDTDTASVLPAYTPAKYRGHHATEEEYLAALRAWAEEKMYTQPADKSTLVGFYGQETMKERIARQPPLKVRIGRKGKGKGMGGERDGGSAGEREGGEGKGEGEGEGERRRGRGSIGTWLSRKRTN